MRNVGRIKLGYYPLPEAEGARLRNLLKYPAEMASVLDPCVGTGAALMQLTEGSLVSRYGVELDADRATAAKDGLLNGVFGNGQDRHIARWRSVKHVTTFEVKEKGFKEIHKRERFSNELALVYEDGRTMVLTESKKEAENAERTPTAGAA
jgi:hypothetical protein